MARYKLDIYLVNYICSGVKLSIGAYRSLKHSYAARFHRLLHSWPSPGSETGAPFRTRKWSFGKLYTRELFSPVCPFKEAHNSFRVFQHFTQLKTIQKPKSENCYIFWYLILTKFREYLISRKDERHISRVLISRFGEEIRIEVYSISQFFLFLNA